MIGILSDAHGNIGAFRTAILCLRSLGARSFYFLGDAVGYIPTLGVIDELQLMGADVQCVLGNHEQMLLHGTVRLKTEPIYQHQPLHEELSDQHVKFLRSWLNYHRVIVNGTSLLLIHGSPNDYTNGYVYPETDLNQFQPQSSFVFMGHTHYPFIRSAKGTTFVNVGSCGLPRDDGRFGSAAIYDPVNARVRVVRFDISAETQTTLAVNPAVNAAVHDVLARRKESIFGDFA